MSDRITTLLGAVVALIIVLILLGGGAVVEPEISRPTSIDIRRDGLAGLSRWLDAAGYPVTSLRQRYDWLLDNDTVPATGNIMITSLPHLRGVRRPERVALAEWIKTGNTIVALNSMYRMPRWHPSITLDYNDDNIGHILPGLAFDLDRNYLDEEEFTEPSTRYIATGNHPITAGVDDVVVSVDDDVAFFLAPAVLDNDLPVVVLMQGAGQHREQALWLTTYGRGRVIASALPNLFSNSQLRERNHARLAANIISYGVNGGHVIFDDMHHGLSTLYDPDAFFADARLYKTLGFLAGLWLLWLLGASSRFYLGDGHPSVRAPGQASFINATGNFLARTLTPVTAAHSLFRHFFAELRRSGRYRGDDAAVLQRLAGDSRLPATLVAQLQHDYSHLQEQPRRIDLEQLHNRMQAIRKELS